MGSPSATAPGHFGPYGGRFVPEALTAALDEGPAALLLLACLVLFIKALYSDMHHTRLERDQRRLNQRLAMLELQLQEQGIGDVNSMAPSTRRDHQAPQ